ncbi:M1 family aminopeptidase [Persicobacter diffluens]|uniref:Aminopeptidase N n=1 Tax=Persicobacter diffluens TaxID=981 RepID=A0AAN4VXC2_9BACT|nr:aminopeptidase N [Persicobacter diffluens]
MKYSHLLCLFFIIFLTNCQLALPENNINLPTSGVSKELAEKRKNEISKLTYHITFDFHQGPMEDIFFTALISFDYFGTDDVWLDFQADTSLIDLVNINDRPETIKFAGDHLILPAQSLASGHQKIEISGKAGRGGLNCSEDLIYTLFVPAKASTVFPCFDQPDLKAYFTNTLRMPENFTAISGGKLISETIHRGVKQLTFESAGPMSTYLYSFAAGVFFTDSTQFREDKMTMLHRIKDPAKRAQNIQAIFDLHTSNIKWLEDYTNIPFPFKKLDFALIPPFQYGGMEHVGAIQYRESQLMLSAPASQSELLRRSSLIGHEVAHMWFGNLVTMEWFDDVWLKEVFANFMAAKMSNPQFPEVDHGLLFFLNHIPSAYEEDRSLGSHPIAQELDNLSEAGSVYGNIIYKKAPVTMKQLELQMGAESFQQGLQKYLKSYAYGNASWDGLIKILDEQAGMGLDLNNWNNAWIKSKGMPTIDIQLKDHRVIISQKGPTEGLWDQELVAGLWDGEKMIAMPYRLSDSFSFPIPERENVWILPDISGYGYGYFRFHPQLRDKIIANFSTLPEPIHRAITITNLREMVLNNDLEPEQYLKLLTHHLPKESSPLVQQLMLRYLKQDYWGFLPERERAKWQATLYQIFQEVLKSEKSPANRTLLKGIFTLGEQPEWLQQELRLMENKQALDSWGFSENDLMEMGMNLMVRMPEKAANIEILIDQSLKNEDKIRKWSFLKPACAAEPEVRSAFFNQLLLPEYRTKEPWVLEGLKLINHPLRANSSAQHLPALLEEIIEVKETGDIFFPKGWVAAGFWGHMQQENISLVDGFLNQNPDYPPKLRNKILQAVDYNRRVSQWHSPWVPS